MCGGAGVLLALDCGKQAAMFDEPFSMVVAIVAISVGAGVLNNWMKLRHSDTRNSGQDQELADLRAQVARLADRVATLETLAVDADRQLSAEISRLR